MIFSGYSSVISLLICTKFDMRRRLRPVGVVGFSSACDAAAGGESKADKKQKMFEAQRVPFVARFWLHDIGVVSDACGRLLLLTFLGETRKVSSRRATPGWGV